VAVASEDDVRLRDLLGQVARRADGGLDAVDEAGAAEEVARGEGELSAQSPERAGCGQCSARAGADASMGEARGFRMSTRFAGGNADRPGETSFGVAGEVCGGDLLARAALGVRCEFAVGAAFLANPFARFDRGGDLRVRRLLRVNGELLDVLLEPVGRVR
jgi:hypothetical protein